VLQLQASPFTHNTTQTDRMADGAVYRAETAPRAPVMTTLGVGLGVLAHGMFNRLRKRPVGYQPWYFALNAVVGGALLAYAGEVYDGVAATMDRRYSGYARLPSWMHDSLTPQQLASEKRRETVRTMYAKFDELSKAEALEYEARLKASRAAREAAGRGEPAPLR